MAQPAPDHEQHYRLLSGWCDGSLSDAEVQQLDELLRTDPAFRKFFLAYMDQHAVLVTDLIAAPDPLLTEEDIRSLEREFDRDGVRRATEAEPGGEVRRRFPGWLRRAPGSWRWWTAAAVLLVGLIALLLWPKGRQEAPTVTVPPPFVPPKGAPAAGLAIVVQLDRVLWEQEGWKPSEGDVLPACRLVLRSGRVTLSLLSGVMLTLEGPAELELISVDQVFCHRGKVQIRVPSEVQGFVLSVPGSDVADLGTEFGVNVGSDGKTRVMVFEGQVEASVIGEADSAQRHRSVPERRALEIDPSGLQIRDLEARPGDFGTPPVLAIPPLALAPSYRDAVLAARPWGYWRFEAIDGGAVPNEVAGRPPLLATGPVYLAGTGNRSVAFGADEAEQYLRMDGPWTSPRAPGYAVELWFAPERIGVAALAGLLVPRGDAQYDHIFLLELTARESHSSLFRRPSVRFLHRWPPGFLGGDNLLFSYYVPYRWHHVVAQMVGDRMELFLNGTPLPPLSVSPDWAAKDCQFLVGRLKPLPRLPGPWEIRPFVGQIDEIALYDHPLSIEEVRRHAALGSPGGRPSEP